MWVDRRADMGGRLATLLDLDARPAFFRPLLIEATAARRERFSPEEWALAIHRYQPKSASLVPAMIQMILRFFG